MSDAKMETYRAGAFNQFRLEWETVGNDGMTHMVRYDSDTEEWTLDGDHEGTMSPVLAKVVVEAITGARKVKRA